MQSEILCYKLHINKKTYIYISKSENKSLHFSLIKDNTSTQSVNHSLCIQYFWIQIHGITKQTLEGAVTYSLFLGGWSGGNILIKHMKRKWMEINNRLKEEESSSSRQDVGTTVSDQIALHPRKF